MPTYICPMQRQGSTLPDANMALANVNVITDPVLCAMRTVSFSSAYQSGAMYLDNGRIKAALNGIAITVTTLDTMTNAEASSMAFGRAVYVYAAGQFKAAKADAGSTAFAIGVIADTSIAASASGKIAIGGTLTGTTTQWDAVTGQSGGLTSGSVYYLSAANGGALTPTVPTTGYNQQVGIAVSTTKMRLLFAPVVKL